MNRTRRHHSSALKQEAVVIVTKWGYSCGAAGRSLGGSGALIGQWKEELEGYQTEALPGKGKRPVEQQRIHDLESENCQLHMERDILKMPRPSLPRKAPEGSIY